MNGVAFLLSYSISCMILKEPLINPSLILFYFISFCVAIAFWVDNRINNRSPFCPWLGWRSDWKPFIAVSTTFGSDRRDCPIGPTSRPLLVVSSWPFGTGSSSSPSSIVAATTTECEWEEGWWTCRSSSDKRVCCLRWRRRRSRWWEAEPLWSLSSRCTVSWHCTRCCDVECGGRIVVCWCEFKQQQQPTSAAAAAAASPPLSSTFLFCFWSLSTCDLSNCNNIGEHLIAKMLRLMIRHRHHSPVLLLFLLFLPSPSISTRCWHLSVIITIDRPLSLLFRVLCLASFNSAAASTSRLFFHYISCIKFKITFLFKKLFFMLSVSVSISWFAAAAWTNIEASYCSRRL